ncbi:transposable element Tc1 transposase [Nephila pilipes]|uniref:Transposable element Tc1 transposase n=1 Tax=Nephila pilipes TaxID=299642 RepID=A0A8X6JHD2_NEPPI|nr:transposable element Tc1 transposase [Nephila pilipes]
MHPKFSYWKRLHFSSRDIMIPVTLLSMYTSDVLITVKVLKLLPQPPDLNPIEHIWRNLEVRVRTHDVKTKCELKTVITEEYRNVSAEITKQLRKSIPACSKTVVNAKGYFTKD